MRFRILGSGSKGNSSLVRTSQAMYLIDNGFSGKEIVRRLESLEINPADIQGILVSHDHIDHVRGVGIFARRFKTPIYMTHETYRVAKDRFKQTEIRYFNQGDTLELGDLRVQTFALPHDAAEPVGFTLAHLNGNGRDQKLGYVTDLGQVTTLVQQQLHDVTRLVFEANHDDHLLMNGPYPWKTKQRIRGRYGHLSNEVSGKFIGELVQQNGLESVTIAHLSENNNDPILARDTIVQTVEKATGKTIDVSVASQHEPAVEIIIQD